MPVRGDPSDSPERPMTTASFLSDIRRAGPKLTTKPFPWPNEAVLKQNYAHPSPPRMGIGNMQFILDLIWNHSRSRYLAALPEEKGS